MRASRETPEVSFGTLTRGPALYSPVEVARLLRVHPRTVLNWIHAGKIDAIKLSARVYRVPRGALVKVLFPERIQHLPVQRVGRIPVFGRGEHLRKKGRPRISA